MSGVTPRRVRWWLVLVLVLCLHLTPVGAVEAPPDAEALPSEAGGVTLPWHLWIGGDVTLTGELLEREPSKVGVDTLSLLVRWEPIPRVALFTELRIEDLFVASEGQRPTTRNREFEIERMYAEVLLTPTLTLRMGKFFTPFGLWNPVHRAPLTWTIDEPAAADTFFPVDVTGLTILHRTTWEGWSFDSTVYGPAQDVLGFPPLQGQGWLVGGRVAAGHAVGIGFGSMGLNAAGFREFDKRAWRTATGVDFELSLGRHQWSSEVTVQIPSARGRSFQGLYVQDAIRLADWIPAAPDVHGILRFETLQPPRGAAAFGGLLGFFWRPLPNLILRGDYLFASRSLERLQPGLHGSVSLLF